jgi:hypothetical protein
MGGEVVAVMFRSGDDPPPPEQKKTMAYELTLRG